MKKEVLPDMQRVGCTRSLDPIRDSSPVKWTDKVAR
jgi:hypothetical protein